MRLQAYSGDNNPSVPANRENNQIVLCADGHTGLFIGGNRRDALDVTPSSGVFSLGLADITVALIGTSFVVAVGWVRVEAAGIMTVGLVQRFYRFVAGGEPVPSSMFVPNEPPTAVPDGVYLAGVTAQQGPFSGSCLATVAIQRLPTEIVDIEFTSLFGLYR